MYVKPRFSFVAYDATSETKLISARILLEQVEEWVIDQLPECEARPLALSNLQRCFEMIEECVQIEQMSSRGPLLKVSE